MADVKISQLPVATTPVDGTEVLPIVQSATTKQVSIANLTAGRAMSASSLTLTTPLAVTSGGTGIATAAQGSLLSATGADTFSATRTPTLGLAGTAAGTLGLSGSTSGVVTLATAATAGTWTFTLPTNGGTNGFILTTNGSGVTSWTNPTALGVDLDVGTTAITGGTTGRVLYNNAGVLGEYSSVPVSFGGTGLTSLTAGYIPYGNGTGAFSSSSNLFFDGTNLGVGVTPSYPVDVYNAANGIIRVKGGSATNQGGAFFVGMAGTSNTLAGFGDGSRFLGGTPDQSVIVYAGSTVPMTFYVNSSERLRIASDGSVGIGTTTPASFGLLSVSKGQGTNSLINAVTTGSFIDGNYNQLGFWYGDTIILTSYVRELQYSSGNTALAFGNRISGGVVGTNMLLDQYGNLGLGVTPSAWNGKAFEFGYAGSALFTTTYSQSILTANTYYASTGYKYAASSIGASYYSQYAGVHSWYNAPSGTAGNAISFTQAMTLDASGNLNTYGTITANANVSGQGCYISRNGSDGGGVVGTAANASLSFTTNSTERARIDASGNLLVGKTSGSYKLDIGGAADTLRIVSTGTGTSGTPIYLRRDGGSSGAIFVTFDVAGSGVGSITYNGSGTAYNQTSDISLKENISDAASALASILTMPIRQFDWKAGGHTDYGVVAQEANEYAPEIVTQGDIWGVDYGRITPRLIKAFQELAAKVSALEAKL